MTKPQGIPITRRRSRRGDNGVMLALLTFIYIINFLDRQLVSILAKPIQDDLHITDGQLGRITGFYFALFYCSIAIPVGWLADRTNRVAVLSVACIVWSAATAACGGVSGYNQLVIARMMVGIGEAGGVPPSYAIIADHYPIERRGTALAVFNLGPPIGSALGIALGALLTAAFSWRVPFFVTGAIGVVSAVVLYFFVAEPERAERDVTGASHVGEHSLSFWENVVAFTKSPVLILASLASGASAFITYGISNFATLFLMREKGMSLSDIAIWYALVVGLGMGGGIYVCGRMIDRFGPRSKSAYALIPASSLIVAMPFFIGFVWAPRWEVALALLSIPMFLGSFFLPATVTLIQSEVGAGRRVVSGALFLFVMNFIGLGLGPTTVGMMSDFFNTRDHEHALQSALYTLSPMYVLAALLFLLLARHIRTQHTI